VVDARVGLEGSFDSRVEIRCDGHQVEFSGNIARYGRSDNLFGYSFVESIRGSSGTTPIRVVFLRNIKLGE